MIKIMLKVDGKEKKLLAPEQKPIRDILAEAGVHISSGDKVNIDGRELSMDDLARNILDLGYLDSSELTFGVEYDLPWETDRSDDTEPGSAICPSKARILGCACIIMSAFTPDELRDFQRYMPEVLTMRDERGEPVFAISLDERSPGSINQYGAVFSRYPNEDGRATMTIIIDPECDDREDAVREKLGSAILSLTDMEEHLMPRLSELQERKNLLKTQISIG